MHVVQLDDRARLSVFKLGQLDHLAYRGALDHFAVLVEIDFPEYDFSIVRPKNKILQRSEKHTNTITSIKEYDSIKSASRQAACVSQLRALRDTARKKAQILPKKRFYKS